jgi:hypothetical protein
MIRFIRHRILRRPELLQVLQGSRDGWVTSYI